MNTYKHSHFLADEVKLGDKVEIARKDGKRVNRGILEKITEHHLTLRGLNGFGQLIVPINDANCVSLLR